MEETEIGSIYKINVDASFERMRGGGIGLVVKDHTGTLIRGQAMWYKQEASVFIMEAQAIHDAVKLATERGYLRVEIETDAQEVVKIRSQHMSGG